MAGPSTAEIIESQGEIIIAAARVLIGVIRGSERNEHARSTGDELTVEVELTGGGTETWKITIVRTASSH